MGRPRVSCFGAAGCGGDGRERASASEPPALRVCPCDRRPGGTTHHGARSGGRVSCRIPGNGDDDLSASTVSGIRAVLRRYERHAVSLDDAVREIRELIEHDRARRRRP